MLRLFLVFLCASFLAACGDENQEVNLQESLKKDTAVKSQQIIFAEPQSVDSSPIVIYPLMLQTESYGGSSYGSGRGGERGGYWNLVFYNTETQRQTLLTADKKIFIHSINLESPSSSSGSSKSLWAGGINVYRNNIIYTAVANDYNRNKKLDEDDPTYLFVSNRDGTSFRQISPDAYSINSWEAVEGTTKIIMQGKRDDNLDKEFNDDDPSVPLVVDIGSQKPAVETFSQNFVDSLKQRLVTIWKQ